jgi:hypothetical protein
MTSLKLVDETQKFSLLENYPLYSQTSLNHQYIIQPNKNKNTAFTVDNLLSHGECQEIIQNVQNKTFLNLKTVYSENVRDSTRLCVFDSQLSSLLWKRLNKTLKREHLEFNFYPIGFKTFGIWEPKRINNCFRISKYESPSSGFLSHFDNQFTTSFNDKSVFSMVIYLNDDFDGGETVIHEELLLNVDDEINNETFEGFTVQEEIKKVGVQNYKKHFVRPKMGKCVLFSHSLLHSGESLTKGVKYIIRTDVIFEKKLSWNSNFHLNLFKRCSQFFQEAQQLELENKAEKSSELYEKSLSIRRYVTNSERNIQRGPIEDFTRLEDCWMIIYSFSNVEDHLKISKTCKTMYSYFESFKDQLWSNIRSKHFPKDSTKMDHEKFCLEKSKLFIPHVTRIHGGFQFKYDGFPISNSPKDFFLENQESCLRVVALYTLILFGGNDTEEFIAEYNPETQMIKKCPLKWLLICAFYQLPCYGVYFHLGVSNKLDIRRNFEDVKEFHRIEYFMNIPDSKDFNFNFQKFQEIQLDKKIEMSEKLMFDEEDGVISLEEDCALIKKQNKQKTETVENLFETFVDKFYLKKKYNVEQENNISLMKHIQNPDVYQYNFEDYKTGYTTLHYQNGDIFYSTCNCGLKFDFFEGISRETNFNNLICDFSKNSLKIRDYESKEKEVFVNFNIPNILGKYVAELTNLQWKGFNHASCQCGPDDMTVESKKKSQGIIYKKNNFVNKIGIVVHGYKGVFTGKVSTEYYWVNSF